MGTRGAASRLDGVSHTSARPTQPRCTLLIDGLIDLPDGGARCCVTGCSPRRDVRQGRKARPVQLQRGHLRLREGEAVHADDHGARANEVRSLSEFLR